MEKAYELRPRKLYHLTPLGEALSDSWLTKPLTKREIFRERDIVLLKFLFAEKQLPPQEVLAWLDHYEHETIQYETWLSITRDPTFEEWIVHSRLLVEADLMGLKMQWEWIQLARQRLLEADT